MLSFTPSLSQGLKDSPFAAAKTIGPPAHFCTDAALGQTSQPKVRSRTTALFICALAVGLSGPIFCPKQ